MGRMEWLVKNLSSDFGKSGRPWESVFAVAVWIFWKMRNAEVFQSQEAAIMDPMNHIFQLVDAFTRAQSRQGMGLVKFHANSPALISWRKPEIGWIKINMDAARQESLRRVACGGVARDCQGNVVAGFARFIGDCSTLVGIKMVHLESDSLMAINLLNRPIQSCHPCFGILIGIKRLLQQDWMVRLDHVLREGNMVADACAKHALGKGTDLEVFSVAPAAVARWVKHDANGGGLVRSGLA
ncbi:reverse transcriptase [Senna tora]|uniref:Reverse transcriptase n=1 Tax=Senna tora TaxID=362788 RepID=A0A834SY31_9FABA|nr:reverse transcriptase [Senna tora]